MPTNKEQLQQEHENIIWNIPFDGDGDDKDKASSYCTTLTEMFMGRFTDYLTNNYYDYMTPETAELNLTRDNYLNGNDNKVYQLQEILTLFMQQEYKQ